MSMQAALHKSDLPSPAVYPVEGQLLEAHAPQRWAAPRSQDLEAPAPDGTESGPQEERPQRTCRVPPGPQPGPRGYGQCVRHPQSSGQQHPEPLPRALASSAKLSCSPGRWPTSSPTWLCCLRSSRGFSWKKLVLAFHHKMGASGPG